MPGRRFMDFGVIDRLIARHGADEVVRRVGPYLTEHRVARIETLLGGRLDGVQVAVERLEDPHNGAAVVRTAEALGVLHVHAIEVESGALHGSSTTQGAYHWVHTYHHPDRETFLAALRRRGTRLAGALMGGTHSVDELPVDRPLCVVFGNEKVGLSSELLAACDLTFRIPMVGMSESLNLSVSAAIALYQLTRARRALLGTSSDLAPDELALLRARYYARSIDERMRDGLFG
jgi:tRNA (guanosine-2'-O-)-methyltransferase